MTRSDVSAQIIALEGRLKQCPLVRTLGVRPNFFDYDEPERSLIRKAPKIYYPSSFYAELFNTLGKPTFPSCDSYRCAQDKIKQTALFHLAGISHPLTRVFYGRRQKRTILDHFGLPLIAKVARGSARGRGVFLIRSRDELDEYCQVPEPAYIQEYLPIDRDMRVVVIGKKVRHAYWRTGAPGDFRNNVSAGGRIELDAVPREAHRLALYAAERCRWDDVGLDICEYKGDYFVLEGNMKYGREGFSKAGIDYFEMMTDLIRNGEI